jgi:hypothetical protein
MTPAWEIVAEKSAPHWLELRDPDGWYEASVKWDGCVHFLRHFNEPDGKGDTDYLHICDLDEEIARLTALRDMSRAHFGPDWPS